MKMEFRHMRNLVIAVGGPLEATESKKSYLWRVAEITGLSFRVIAAAFYGEQLSPQTEQKLKAAAGRHEARILASRFESLAQSLGTRDPDFHSADIDAFRQMAVRLRGFNMPGDAER